MNKQVMIGLEMPLIRFPKGVNRRLQHLLDKQDRGDRLTVAERREAEGLVELVELVSLLKLRAQRAIQEAKSEQGQARPSKAEKDARTHPKKPRTRST